MVTNDVKLALRLEGACALAICATLFARSGGKWWVFFVCFFLPDLSMLGYLRGPKIGSYFYNWVHTYVTPAVLGLLSLRDWNVGLLTALVWGAHIGFDRMLGYGLKYPGGFHETHLGRIGKRDGIAAEHSAAS